MPTHTYAVHCNGRLSLSTHSFWRASDRLSRLRNAGGPVTLEIDGEEVNGACLEQLRHVTTDQYSTREPTEAELERALSC